MERRDGTRAQRRTLKHRGPRRRRLVRICFWLALTCAPQVSAAFGQTEQQGMTAPEQELAQATELTRAGRFDDAVPLFLDLERGGETSFPVEFNLALCLVGSSQPDGAIPRLLQLARSPSNSAAVQNLLAQAYISTQQPEQAWVAAQASARLAPDNEKLFAYLLDSATDHGEFALGLRMATLGLTTLPNSQRLHYERAVFLARMDRLEEAQPEFARATALAPSSDLGYLAQVQSLLYAEHQTAALALLRAGVAAGHTDSEMLSLLGTVLLYLGAIPGQPEFAEAHRALAQAVTERPNFSTAQLALGKVFLADAQPAQALPHLEAAQRLEPRNPAVYTSLAEAYRRTGDRAAAKRSLAVLGTLLHEDAAATVAGQAP